LIGWIKLSAIFLYNLVLESGQLEIIKHSISSLSPDRRIQALLIAFLFSAFMEATTGMGAPVAICAALLIGIGFPPLPAALVCLVGNSVPVPFGSIGVPTIMMASVSGISIGALTRAEATNIAILAFIVPIVMMVLLVDYQGLVSFPCLDGCDGHLELSGVHSRKTQRREIGVEHPELAVS
jgi:lactate permease